MNYLTKPEIKKLSEKTQVIVIYNFGYETNIYFGIVTSNRPDDSNPGTKAIFISYEITKNNGHSCATLHYSDILENGIFLANKLGTPKMISLDLSGISRRYSYS